jgi:hypothetical protein
MGETRVMHGVFWGVVAALIAGVIPVAAIALGVWPAPEPITAAVFGRALGIASTGVVAGVLAVLWQLLLGAFWGGLLAYVTGPVDLRPERTRPSTLAQGLGVGLLRWLAANLGPLLWLRWGAFGLLVTPRIALATLITDVVFGVTAGWLLQREEAGRLRVPARSEPLFARLSHAWHRA